MKILLKLVSFLIAGRLLLPAIPGMTQERGKVEKEDDEWIERLDQTVEAAFGGTLYLEADRGGIEVTTWDQEEVRLAIVKKAEVFTEAEARKLFDAYQVQITSSEGNVRVIARAEGERRLKGLEVEIKATVPVRYSVDLSTQGGKIAVGDLLGNAKAATTGGSIDIGRIRDGNVEAHTQGGGIEIQEIANGSGQASTAGGSIQVGVVSGDLEVETAGGGIQIGRVGGRVKASTAGGSIQIQEGGKGALAETVGGEIRVGKAGGEVEVKTLGGSIQIGPVQGAVRAETAGGSIQIDLAEGPVTAKTAGGSISVAGSGGPVKAETAGGSIQIANARGYLEAETAGGRIEAELAIADPAADTHCTLETAGGDIVIRLPAELAAAVDAEIRLEGRQRREYNIYSDFPLEIEKRGNREIIGQGALNGGGDLIRLRTTNGDIYLKKR